VVKKPARKKKPKPRLPMEAVLKLRSHAVITKKDKKRYDRKRMKQQTLETIKEERNSKQKR